MTEPATNREQTSVRQILKELEGYGGRRFPKVAVQDAIEQREVVTPELLRVLEQVATDPAAFAERDDYMLHIYAMYLLVQFREKRAYPLLVRIFSAPGDIPDLLVGDIITDGLSRILASVYDGDPEPLQRLVEDESIDEYVRSAALETFIELVNSDQMSREEALSYHRALFEERLPRKPSHVWNSLACAVSDLAAPELMDHLRGAYARDLVDNTFVTLEDVETELRAPSRRRRDSAIVTDTIAEIEWWPCFRPEPRLKKFTSSISPSRSVERQPKVGRNELCPCASGKKYKRCCGVN